MPRWLPRILSRIRNLAAARQILFTLKARRELAALEFALDEEDACVLLAELEAEDSAGRLASATTGEWMYVFMPRVAGETFYVKVILRNECIVVSFHEDEGGGHEEDA
ncbi:MAG TPA: type II toxin-antitoxin system MqsR family toxin [Polyangiaceae bacterium]|jgi:hypothetical protein|nr:type II toxin-antitoxin system MqsR family toxin [Polyangiaceae bacterium]